MPHANVVDVSVLVGVVSWPEGGGNQHRPDIKEISFLRMQTNNHS
jgi:hypothetical protein